MPNFRDQIVDALPTPASPTTTHFQIKENIATDPRILKSALFVSISDGGATDSVGSASSEHSEEVKSDISRRSINVNDPGLITLVNKLQDVFTTVGVSKLVAWRFDI